MKPESKMDEKTYTCNQCGYYEDTGCPEGVGWCTTLECRMKAEEVICNQFEEK